MTKKQQIWWLVACAVAILYVGLGIAICLDSRKPEPKPPVYGEYKHDDFVETFPW